MLRGGVVIVVVKEEATPDPWRRGGQSFCSEGHLLEDTEESETGPHWPWELLVVVEEESEAENKQSSPRAPSVSFQTPVAERKVNSSSASHAPAS